MGGSTSSLLANDTEEQNKIHNMLQYTNSYEHKSVCSSPPITLNKLQLYIEDKRKLMSLFDVTTNMPQTSLVLIDNLETNMDSADGYYIIKLTDDVEFLHGLYIHNPTASEQQVQLKINTSLIMINHIPVGTSYLSIFDNASFPNGAISRRRSNTSIVLRFSNKSLRVNLNISWLIQLCIDNHDFNNRVLFNTFCICHFSPDFNTLSIQYNK